MLDDSDIFTPVLDLTTTIGGQCQIAMNLKHVEYSPHKYLDLVHKIHLSLGCRGHPTFGFIATVTKEKCLHLGGEVSLMFRIDRTQALFVQQHGLSLQPLLPSGF
jgi:hypothetical protein